MTDEAFASVGAGATAWTTGRVITKDFPAPHLVRLRMHVEERQRHWPGQHYLIRLRAPDDYTAQRSYSLASDDSDPLVEFLVERLPDGEVSEFLADVAEVGDVLELRGPIGRWFRWDTHTPALCLVGGTGIVPAVSMLRAARHLGRSDLLRVVAVARSREEMPYADELARAGATLALTREATPDRPAGAPTIEEITPLLDGVDLAFVCGSARFAGYAENLLVDAGLDPGVDPGREVRRHRLRRCLSSTCPSTQRAPLTSWSRIADTGSVLPPDTESTSSRAMSATLRLAAWEHDRSRSNAWSAVRPSASMIIPLAWSINGPACDLRTSARWTSASVSARRAWVRSM